jgi:hypothetical protein
MARGLARPPAPLPPGAVVVVSGAAEDVWEEVDEAVFSCVSECYWGVEEGRRLRDEGESMYSNKPKAKNNSQVCDIVEFALVLDPLVLDAVVLPVVLALVVALLEADVEPEVEADVLDTMEEESVGEAVAPTSWNSVLKLVVVPSLTLMAYVSKGSDADGVQMKEPVPEGRPAVGAY